MVRKSVKAAAKAKPAGSSSANARPKVGKVAPVAKSLGKKVVECKPAAAAASKSKVNAKKQSWKSWVTLSAKNLEKLPSTPMLNMLKKSPEHAPSLIEIGSGRSGAGSNGRGKDSDMLPSVSDEVSVDEYMQAKVQGEDSAFTPAEMSLNYGGWANKQIIEGVQARERRRSRERRREWDLEEVTPSSNRTNSDEMTPVQLNDIKSSKDVHVEDRFRSGGSKSKSASKKNEPQPAEAFSVLAGAFSNSNSKSTSATNGSASSTNGGASLKLGFLQKPSTFANALPMHPDLGVSPASASSVGSSQKQNTAWQGMVYASRKQVDPDDPSTWAATRDGVWSWGAIRTKQILKWRGQVELTKKGTIKKKIGRPTKEQQAQKAAFIAWYEQQHGHKPNGHAFRNDLSVLGVKSFTSSGTGRPSSGSTGAGADADLPVSMTDGEGDVPTKRRPSGRRISGELQIAASEAGFAPLSNKHNQFADDAVDANPRNHFLRFVYYAQDLPKSKFSLKSVFAEPSGNGSMMDLNTSCSSSSSSSSMLKADEVDRNVFTMPAGWHVCDAKTNYLPTVKNDKNKEFPLVVCFSGHVRWVRQFDALVQAVLEQQMTAGNVSKFAVTQNVHSGVTAEQVKRGGGSVPVLCSGGC